MKIRANNISTVLIDIHTVAAIIQIDTNMKI